jgi:hypothetical protein
MKKTALGLGVAIVSLYCVLLSEFLHESSFFQDNKLLVSLSLTGAGMVALITGLLVARTAGRPGPGQRVGQPAREVFPLVSMKFWGVMFMIFGAGTYLMVGLPELRQMAKQSKTLSQITGRLSGRGTAAVKPAIPLRLQGIMIDPQKETAAAIINGQFVRVGDMVAGARVIRVSRQGVEVERDEQTKMLELREDKTVVGKTGKEEAKAK